MRQAPPGEVSVPQKLWSNFWRCLSFSFLDKPETTTAFYLIIIAVIQCGSGESSLIPTQEPTFPLVLVEIQAPYLWQGNFSASVSPTFTLHCNFIPHFLAKSSSNGEWLVPLTMKAFATWVTAYKKHSWDHQLFYFYLFFSPRFCWLRSSWDPCNFPGGPQGSSGQTILFQPALGNAGGTALLALHLGCRAARSLSTGS